MTEQTRQRDRLTVHAGPCCAPGHSSSGAESALEDSND